MVARFRGVSQTWYRGKFKWLAQNRPLRIWRHGFRTRGAAAEWLAQKLKKKVSELQVSQGPTPTLAMSPYEGVIAHRREGGQPVFEARVRGELISTHCSAIAAAAVVAKKTRTTIRHLTKRKPLTPKLAKGVFRASYSVFRQYMPGDLADLFRHESVNARAFSQVRNSWGVGE